MCGPFHKIWCLSSFWVTFNSSNGLGEKRVLFLNSGQNLSIFEALWLSISNLFFLTLKNIISWAQDWFYLILVLPDKPFEWYTMQNSWLQIILWISENAKMTWNGPSSQNCIFWLQLYRCFQKSPRNLRGINYQMEHMWGAQHKHKNSPRLQQGSQLRPTLYRSFTATL